MANPVKLKEVLATRRGILLDSNVLPHFVPDRHRQILLRAGVSPEEHSSRFSYVKRVLKGRLSTSIANVVECMAKDTGTVSVAEALVSAYRATVDDRVLCPRPAERNVLSLYASRGESNQLAFRNRCERAQLALLEVAEHGVWPEPAATTNIENLFDLVAGFAIRDRGWIDVYTAQTTTDHNLVLLTEDLTDFRDVDRLQYLVDYEGA